MRGTFEGSDRRTCSLCRSARSPGGADAGGSMG